MTDEKYTPEGLSVVDLESMAYFLAQKYRNEEEERLKKDNKQLHDWMRTHDHAQGYKLGFLDCYMFLRRKAEANKLKREITGES
ncbi:hypothetical protein HYV49_02110 [Candidatus Pacearchaeota archaeon]|nr:hypothetical protein [Candidatus Pacearchaeota archaeon]